MEGTTFFTIIDQVLELAYKIQSFLPQGIPQDVYVLDCPDALQAETYFFSQGRGVLILCATALQHKPSVFERKKMLHKYSNRCAVVLDDYTLCIYL